MTINEVFTLIALIAAGVGMTAGWFITWRAMRKG